MILHPLYGYGYCAVDQHRGERLQICSVEGRRRRPLAMQQMVWVIQNFFVQHSAGVRGLIGGLDSSSLGIRFSVRVW